MSNLYYHLKRSCRQFFCLKNNYGFTMMELVVSIAIMLILGTIMFMNFRSSSSGGTALNQVVASVVADVRQAQSMALSGTQYQGQIVCGYGVHYISSLSLNNYIIYAKARPGGGCPTLSTRNYAVGDFIVENIVLPNENFQFKSNACPNGSDLAFTGVTNDVFYEPPDPKTYIANNPPIFNRDLFITIIKKPDFGGCNGPYTTIKVHSSGSVDVCTGNGSTCI